MYNWINILYPVYILIIAFWHCSMSVFIHCRALRAFTHVCISTESFQGSYPDPLNKSIYTIIHSAFVSVHCHRPSARAAPMLGVVINLWQKSGTQCGAYGWWLALQMHINISQQHVGQLMADPKVIQTLSSFDEKRAVNVRHFSSGQQADFGSMQYHCKSQYSWNHVLEGSAHTTLGTLEVAMKTRTGSSRSQTTLTVKGWLHSCPRSQTTYRLEVWLTMLAAGRCWHCTVDNLLCQGHMTLTGCWEHQTLCKVREALNFLEVPGALWGWSATKSSHWILQGQTILFFHFFAPLPHSRLESGYCNFL